MNAMKKILYIIAALSLVTACTADDDWLKNATEEELDMLYIHLSNGLLHVVVDGYGKYSRQRLSDFINRIVVSTLRAFK